MALASILIVDDDENIRLGLGLTLRSDSYRLLAAASAQDALELLRKERVDLVLSDYQMPGMNGLEFLRLVADRYPDTARIMLTGQADMHVTVDAINSGAIHRFLVKPCERLELRVAIHLALEQLELERENRRLLALIRTHPELAKLEADQPRPPRRAIPPEAAHGR